MTEVKIGSWSYHQIQINGERITTNVSFKSCLLAQHNPMEVFISRIPFTMYEDNLIPLFETVGVVMQLRLMMNYSGRNRGFGYVIFLEPKDGYRAIANLNNILVSSWCRLQLCVSKNTRSLWLANVSEDLDADGVVELILSKVDPLKISVCYRRGKASYILKFATHRDAALSRKLLLREVLDFGPLARTNWDLYETSRV